MSYAVRNTIILLSVLLLFVGGGWAYMYFVQWPKIEKLEKQVDQKRQELTEKQAVANRYPVVSEQFNQANEYLNNFDKSLYKSNDEDRVFHFLNSINKGSSYTDFTFAFNDSTKQDKFGTIIMKVTGDGYYRNVINFIRRIELSAPLNKISDIQINPINELESYGKVNYTFTLRSLYDRKSNFENKSLSISNKIFGSVYNPFFPLIRSVENNTENLVNVEQSSLIAVGSNKVFIIDQNGLLKKLTKGEEVYLGSLSSINVNRGRATFTLNKGGIIEYVTLQINNDEQETDGEQTD